LRTTDEKLGAENLVFSGERGIMVIFIQLKMINIVRKKNQNPLFIGILAIRLSNWAYNRAITRSNIIR
jgi:hypothetical protein